MDGRVVQLVEELLRPISSYLDYLFYAGVIYGAKQLTSFVLGVLRGVRTYAIPIGGCRPGTDLTTKYGKWAVITAATSGLGLAFAEEFASRGVNVVLLSHSYEDLVQVVSNIQTEYGVQAYGIHANFSLGPRVFQEIEEALNGLEIGILVNTVAIRYDHPQYFALVPIQRLWQLIDVNVAATTVLTHMLLPQMIERRRGAVINVCSLVADLPPVPLIGAYTATMAYVKSLSQALKYENANRGITVQTLVPCFISGSEMRPTVFTPSPRAYVQHALATLGLCSHTCGYWVHGVMWSLFSLIPDAVWFRLTMHFHRLARKTQLQLSLQRDDRRIFTRRRFSSMSGHHHRPRSPRKEHHFPGLRRLNSPLQRLTFYNVQGALSSVGTPPPSPGWKGPAAAPSSLHRVSREEHDVNLNPTPPVPLAQKSDSGGSSGGQQQTSEFPFPTAPSGGSALATSTPVVGTFVEVPRLNLSASHPPPSYAASAATRAHYSRVLVIPSLARVSSTSRPGPFTPGPGPGSSGAGAGANTAGSTYSGQSLLLQQPPFAPLPTAVLVSDVESSAEDSQSETDT